MRTPLIEFYSQIKFVHVAAALASGGLFLLRWIATQLGNGWLGMGAPIRYVSYSIDTVLLTAALMLATVVHQYPLVHAWLTVKVALVIVYIVLGSFALKRGRTPRGRRVYAMAALLVYAMIVSIARTHHPLGVFAPFAVSLR